VFHAICIVSELLLYYYIQQIGLGSDFGRLEINSSV